MDADSEEQKALREYQAEQANIVSQRLAMMSISSSQQPRVNVLEDQENNGLGLFNFKLDTLHEEEDDGDDEGEDGRAPLTSLYEEAPDPSTQPTEKSLVISSSPPKRQKVVSPSDFSPLVTKEREPTSTTTDRSGENDSSPLSTRFHPSPQKSPGKSRSPFRSFNLH